MNNPKKSRILAAPKTYICSHMTVFLWLKNSGHQIPNIKPHVRQVLLFGKNGRRWPLYINLKPNKMENTVNTKFWFFDQNNSGGYFVEDDKNGVGECIIIEAINKADAIDRFRKIGAKVADFWNYCSCCGERWSEEWIDEDEGTKEPTIWGDPVLEVEKSMFRSKVYIHHYDGTIKKIELKEKPVET